jgi:hypothetical protein
LLKEKGKMKNSLVRIVFMCFCLIIVGLISTNISYANFTAKNIMGMWLLDEGSGNTVKDTSGNGNDGKIVGATWTDGKFGKALQFNDNHVEIPGSKSIDDFYNGFTYLLWVKPTGAPKDAANTRLIERDWHNPAVQIGAADFYGSISVNADQAQTNVRGGAWKMNEWTFVALTYDGKSIRIYADAKMVGEKAVGKPDAKPNAATPVAQVGAIWFGAWKGGANWDYIGVLDEVGIFNVPLTEDDQKNIMSNGLVKTAAVSSADKMAVTWGDIKK